MLVNFNTVWYGSVYNINYHEWLGPDLIKNIQEYPAVIAIFTTELNDDHCNFNVCGVVTDALKEVYKEL